MKKLLVLGTLLAFCAPVFAQPKCEGDNCPPKRDGKPRQEMKMKKAPKMSKEMQAQLKAAKEQRKARKAQFKANEEKLEKLVKEWNRCVKSKSLFVPKACRTLNSAWPA